MIGYFDASVLLSLLINDKHAAVAKVWWHQCEDRASSMLLEAECIVVLRRTAAQQRLPKKWLAEAETLLAKAVEEIQLRTVDREIVQQLRGVPALSQCRTADAIHLATALHFQAHIDTADFRLCTFDHRMALVATSVGLRPLATT